MVTLIVEKPELKITKQPVSATVAVGEKATFTVQAEGEGLTYQWYYRNAGASTWNQSSCTSASYSQTGKESINGRQFYCEVTDAYDETVETDVVTLNVERTELVITSQPSSKTVAVGEKATFTVKATGDGLTYQWWYNSGSGWNKSSCTSASYSQTGKESVNGRQFYCVVTDAYDNEKKTNTVTLTVE